jgi:transcriptional regulator with XRE-family HTH domain
MIMEKLQGLISVEQSMNDLLTDDEMKQVAELSGLYDLYYKISDSLVEYRKAHGLSQKLLAEVLNVSQAMVSKLESGDYNYTIEQLWKVSKKIGYNFNIVFEPVVATESREFFPIEGSLAQEIPTCVEDVHFSFAEMELAA